MVASASSTNWLRWKVMPTLRYLQLILRRDWRTRAVPHNLAVQATVDPRSWRTRLLDPTRRLGGAGSSTESPSRRADSALRRGHHAPDGRAAQRWLRRCDR